MGFSEAGILPKVAIVVTSVAALLLIIGLATNSWMKSDSGIDVNFGLFKLCISSTCSDLTNSQSTDALKATRAFMVLGVLTAIAAIVTVIVSILKSDIKALVMVAMVLPYVAGLCGIIAVGIFGGEVAKDNSTYDYSWSFGLAITGALIAIISGVLLTIDFVMK